MAVTKFSAPREWKQERTEHRRPGKKAVGSILLFLLLMCLTFMASGALAQEKADNDLIASEPGEAVPDLVFYQTGTLPGGIWGRSTVYSVRLFPEGTDHWSGERIRKASAELVSGDKELMDIISFEEEDGETEIRFNWESAKTAGEAVVRIHMESESYFSDREVTFRVIPYAVLPLLETVPDQIKLDAAIGDTLLAKDLADAWLKLSGGIEADGKPEIRSFEEETEGLDFPGSASAPWHDSVVILQKKVFQSLRLEQDPFIAENGKYSIQAEISIPLKISVTKDSVIGPDRVAPGASAQYQFSDEKQEVVWQAEGEGVSISGDGLLTADEGAPFGSAFRITATRKGDEAVFAKEGIICEETALFKSAAFSVPSSQAGFTVNLPNGAVEVYGIQGRWSSHDYVGQEARYMATSTFRASKGGDRTLRITCNRNRIKGRFAEDPDTARAVYDEFFHEDDSSYRTKNKIDNWRSEETTIAGHPARLVTYTQDSKRTGKTACGTVCYARNDRILSLQVVMSGWEDDARVTFGDLMELASRMEYDESQAPYKEADVQLTVSAENGAASLGAGQSLAFAASFVNPEMVNAEKKNDGVTWSVVDAATGEATKLAKISKDGVLTAGKKIADAAEVEVRAESDSFGTVSSLRVTLLPAVSKLAAEPSALTFYEGETEARTVTVSAEPAAARAEGLTWTNSAPKVIELTDLGDGTASILPLSAGKANVTVKEAGGKSAKLSVSVMVPVESLELTAKGKTAPGGTVTVAPKFTPAKPGDKTVEWSLNVDDQTAAINDKGQLKISKNAAPGTVIQVTCRAIGAPEPVSATLEITVTEK